MPVPNGDGVTGSGELLKTKKDGIEVSQDGIEDPEDAVPGDGAVETGDGTGDIGDIGGLLIKLENIDGIMVIKD